MSTEIQASCSVMFTEREEGKLEQLALHHIVTIPFRPLDALWLNIEREIKEEIRQWCIDHADARGEGPTRLTITLVVHVKEVSK